MRDVNGKGAFRLAEHNRISNKLTISTRAGDGYTYERPLKSYYIILHDSSLRSGQFLTPVRKKLKHNLNETPRRD